jgi:autotransporter adhesin
MQAMNRVYCWLTGVAVLGLASPAVGQTPLLELEKSDGTKVMQVNEYGGLVVLGDGSGAIPATGAGRRLMWWPARRAFRAGWVGGSQWDDANIGEYSVAMGSNTIASGEASTAMGLGTTASGDHSVAMGSNTTASGSHSVALAGPARAEGSYSTAIGFDVTAGGEGSTAIGYEVSASQSYATAIGYSTYASGTGSVALGYSTTASGLASTAMGTGTTASGEHSTAMGDHTTAGAFASLALGRYNVVEGNPVNWNTSDPALVVGNGSSDADRSNALTLRKNGDLTIAGRLASGNAISTGSYATALGYSTVASGLWSTALGVNTTASASGSTAIGSNTDASGSYSTAMGEGSTASGDLSTAMGIGGTTASGYGSMAFGIGATADGTYSIAIGHVTTTSGTEATAMGLGTTAQAYASTALGRYNVLAGSMTNWVATDPLLVVGNGSSDAARSNAFTLLKNGNLTIAGTLTQNSDARLKENVQPLTDVLSRLTGIRGVTFRFKDAKGPAGGQVGLLAQEVQQAFPELVHEDGEGNLSVAYGNFTAVLLEAIKEQQQENQQLRALLADLESTVQRLQARMDATGRY